jgi:hypothetical protein
MEQEAQSLPRLADLNKSASIDQLNKEVAILEKHSIHGTFAKAIETLKTLINKIEKE